MSNTSVNRWIGIAQRYADALLRHGTDQYAEHTPMWAQMIDLRTLRIPAQQTAEEWEAETATWEEDRSYDWWLTSKHGMLFAPMSNLNWDGSNIRLMHRAVAMGAPRLELAESLRRWRRGR